MQDKKMGFIVDIPQFQMWLHDQGLKKSIPCPAPTPFLCQILLLSSQVTCQGHLRGGTEEYTP